MVAPNRNAAMSVMEVTVIETPAFFMVRAILCGTGSDRSTADKFSRL